MLLWISWWHMGHLRLIGCRRRFSRLGASPSIRTITQLPQNGACPHGMRQCLAWSSSMSIRQTLHWAVGGAAWSTGSTSTVSSCITSSSSFSDSTTISSSSCSNSSSSLFKCFIVEKKSTRDSVRSKSSHIFLTFCSNAIWLLGAPRVIWRPFFKRVKKSTVTKCAYIQSSMPISNNW